MNGNSLTKKPNQKLMFDRLGRGHRCGATAKTTNIAISPVVARYPMGMVRD